MTQHGCETLDPEHAQGLHQPEPVQQVVGSLFDFGWCRSIERPHQERHIAAHCGRLSRYVRMEAQPAFFRFHPEEHRRLTLRNLEPSQVRPEPFRDLRQLARRVEQRFEPGIPVGRTEARDELVEPHDL